MTTTADQMKIFDTLNAAASVTVIDVRAGLLSPALASLRDIGFLDAAKSGQITFAVFHILGPSIASLDEIAETANFMQGAKYFLVKNFINDTSSSSGTRRPTIPISTASRTPPSSRSRSSTKWPMSRSRSPRCRSSNSSPTRASNDEAANYSFVLRGYVRHWLANVWSEFDRIKLTDLVGAGKSAGRGSGEK